MTVVNGDPQTLQALQVERNMQQEAESLIYEQASRFIASRALGLISQLTGAEAMRVAQGAKVVTMTNNDGDYMIGLVLHRADGIEVQGG